MKRRKYTLKKRAQQQQETRERIVRAVVDLHEELGPARTSVSAIADRAGVQRLTVYRHFPDEAALLRACTTHWLAQNPPPDPAGWQDVRDPLARSDAALGALYRYYARTQQMWTSSYRDVTEVPALARQMEGFEAYLARLRADLSSAFDVAAAQKHAVDLVVAHALRFSTWKSLEELSADDATKVDLVVGWLRCLSGASA